MTFNLKISKAGVILLIFFYCQPVNVFSQDSLLNKYGLLVIKDKRSFIQSIKYSTTKQMINIKKIIPTVVLDLRYAGTQNFMHKKFYFNVSTTYLRKPAATALQQIQKELAKQDLGIKIFDAYRPYSVTEQMWEPVKDDRYAADPKNGSGHNRGVAVDVTLINLKTKKELNMGTGFDNFSDTAHHDFKFLTQEILNNRILLRSIMEKYGFKALETEWWHYSLPNAKDFELLDVSFEDIKTINQK